MKAILMLTLVITVVVLTVIGCLMIVDVVSMDTGQELVWKSLAAIAVLGVASTVIAVVIANKKNPDD